MWQKLAACTLWNMILQDCGWDRSITVSKRLIDLTFQLIIHLFRRDIFPGYPVCKAYWGFPGSTQESRLHRLENTVGDWLKPRFIGVWLAFLWQQTSHKSWDAPSASQSPGEAEQFCQIARWIALASWIWQCWPFQARCGMNLPSGWWTRCLEKYGFTSNMQNCATNDIQCHYPLPGWISYFYIFEFRHPTTGYVHAYEAMLKQPRDAYAYPYQKLGSPRIFVL